MRWCSYYANGTIDIPTLSVITAWVEVGSRLCIGDPIPEPKPVYRSLTEQLSDIFSAKISSPVAWRTGPDLPEPFEMVSFFVESSTKTVDGSLFGEPAKIRFRPVGFDWSFSDGKKLSGASVAKGFEEEGNAFGYAEVEYEVDYQLDGSWKYRAAAWSLTSNRVSLKIFDPPRKTLLVP
jgi:hypothetical protein